MLKKYRIGVLPEGEHTGGAKTDEEGGWYVPPAAHRARGTRARTTSTVLH